MSTVSKIINYISYVIFHDYICDFTLNVQNCNVKKPLLSHCSTDVSLDSSKSGKRSLNTARCGRNCTKCFGQVRKTHGKNLHYAIFVKPLKELWCRRKCIVTQLPCTLLYQTCPNRPFRQKSTIVNAVKIADLGNLSIDISFLGFHNHSL